MEREDFGVRTRKMAVRVISLAQAMPKTYVGRHIASQVLRSGTSVGANYCEARGAESRADFAHKLQVALKELRETMYWLEVIRDAGLVRADRLDPLMREVNELTAISVKSVLTAKVNAKRTES